MAGERSGEVGSEIWTIPNILSMLRLALVPVFLVLIVAGDYVFALVVLVVASLTDLLDGYLARRLDQITRLGHLARPVGLSVVGINHGYLPLQAYRIERRLPPAAYESPARSRSRR